MLYDIIKVMRPHQWFKNLFVLTPAIFAKELGDPITMRQALLATAVFSLTSSAIYVVNDLCDAASDRLHPKKCTRPIAAERISKRKALTLIGLLLSLALVGTLFLNPEFAAYLGAYFFLNLVYSLSLKKIPYVDVLCIATGFVLRVLAGAAAAQVPSTPYLLAATFLLAAYLGFGKRLHELKIATAPETQRLVLHAYSEKVLNWLLLFTALATLGTYVSYTFDPDTARFFGNPYLPFSIPFTFFGLYRFLYLVRNRPQAESPTEEMLNDRLFMANLALWCLTMAILVYLI